MGDSVIAWTDQGQVTRSGFMKQVARIGACLPQEGYVLNVCSDRYEFALGLVAAWMVGIPTLLPSDQGRGQLVELARNYPLFQIGNGEVQSYRQGDHDHQAPCDGFD